MFERVFIAGGAGFIGSHFVDRFLAMPNIRQVTVYDNFTSGRHWHLVHHKDDKRLVIVENDIKNIDVLTHAMCGHDLVIHLASNPDIARAITEPQIDFNEGTLLTHNVLEAMRLSGCKRIIYASGSGVYGDTGHIVVSEDYERMMPISTYGASKLAGEAMICSYTHMFDITGVAFRFGNVVGSRQTHGVGYDFLQKLQNDPTTLEVLGNGLQSKSYIYVSDVIDSVLLANEKTTKPFDVYNVATGDYITVREIAQIVIAEVVGHAASTQLRFTHSDRGWKGDVPVIRLCIDKICSLGWCCKYSSEEAIKKSIGLMSQKENMSCCNV